MTQNDNNDNDNRTCSYEGCNATRDGMVRSGGELYCQHDHSIAGQNGWSPESLDGFLVESDGYETLYRAPSRTDAKVQWHYHVQSAENPNNTQPKPELTQSVSNIGFGEPDEPVVLDYLCYRCQSAQETKRVSSVADIPSAPQVYETGIDCPESDRGHQMRLVSARRKPSAVEDSREVPLYEILSAVEEVCYRDSHK